MRTALDFAPLYRSSVGFDRVFSLLDAAMRLPAAEPAKDVKKAA
jgi:molecular chaperone IbpA